MRDLRQVCSLILIPFTIMLALAGCGLAIGGNDAVKHVSDNNTAVRSQRITADVGKANLRAQTANNAANLRAQTAANNAASREAIAGIRADSQVNRAAERTQQTLLVQNASSERLLLQSQHLLAVRADGTQRFNTFLIVVVLLAVLGGCAFLAVYFWNNPKPVVYQPNLPQPRAALPHRQSTAVQTMKPVPYSLFVSDKRFAEAGWCVAENGMGQRLVSGRIVSKCKLLEG